MPTLPNQQSPEGSACRVHNISFWYGSDGMPADRDLPPDRKPLCVKGFCRSFARCVSDRVLGCRVRS